MSLGATDPNDSPAYEDAEHAVLGHWEPGRWWRVLDHDGGIWMETSNRDEAHEAATEHGYMLEREYRFIPAVIQWHEQERP